MTAATKYLILYVYAQKYSSSLPHLFKITDYSNSNLLSRQTNTLTYIGNVRNRKVYRKII